MEPLRVRSARRYSSVGELEEPRLTARHAHFLRRAAAFARRREVSHSNHCALLVRGSKVVAVGFNSYKNDPRCLSHEHVRAIPGRNSVMGVGPHAEVAALSQVRDARGLTLYVARVTRTGEVSSSAPCHSCLTTARALGVRHIIWTEDEASLEIGSAA